MQRSRIVSVTGQFTDPEREAAFRAERLSESLLYARVFFFAVLVLYGLFLARDWPTGEPGPDVAYLMAYVVIFATSLIGLVALDEKLGFKGFEVIVIGWQLLTTAAMATLMSGNSDMVLLQVMARPAIFYLLLPTSFFGTLFNGLFSGTVIFAAYVTATPPPFPIFGLWVATMVIQMVLVGLYWQSNWLRRQQSAAIEAEAQSRNDLIESRQRFEAMFRSVPLPLIVTRTRDGRILNTNDAANTYFGEENLRNLASVRDLYPDPAVREHFRNMLATEREVTGFETKMVLPNGEERDVMISASTVPYGDGLQTIGAVIDISARKAAEERIWRSAHHDALTGLPNRLHFQMKIEEALTGAEGGEVALILLDLDDFKVVNDTLGHDAGDTLLYEVAARLAEVVGADGFVARLGGDEFVITLRAESDARSESAALAERVLTELESPFVHHGRVVSPRASMGIAIFPSDARAPSELLKAADLALYSAKAAGRNRAAFFDRGMHTTLAHRVAVAQDIRPAIAAGHIVPYYQAKVSLQTGEIVGFEALARWRHPARGLLTPAAFDTAFDEPDIAIELGECLLESVARDLGNWRAAGLDPGRLAINLSSAQFGRANLAERMLAILERVGASPASFDVEVTESVLLGRASENVAATIARLKAAGMRVALDDFGTGYASLTHLKQFPVDDIKIDRSFVRDLENDCGDAAIVTAVIQLGRNLGMNVVGEGVETEGQALFLRERGCSAAQGFLFAKPMPASRVPWLLGEGKAAFRRSAAVSTDPERLAS